MTTIIGDFPDPLVNGTTADADQVMADLDWIQSQVNSNALSNSYFGTGTTPMLGVANGGTGGSSYSNNGVIVGGGGSSPMQSTPVTINPSTGAIAGFYTTFNSQSGTTYTVQTSDAGKSIPFTNGSAVTVTLPNSMPVGFYIEGLQLGAGKVTFSAASGATLQNRQTQYSIGGQYGGVSLRVTANSSGNAAVWVLTGDTQS